MAELLEVPTLNSAPSFFVPAEPTPLAEIAAALRNMPALAPLTQSELEWLAQHGQEHKAAAGAILFHEGEPANTLSLLLEGDIHVRRRTSGPVGLFIGRAGQVSGKLPYSRMKSYGGEGYAINGVWSLDIDESRFHEMLVAIPAMGQICVSILLDRVREVTRMEQQAEKLSALGKLAANLAHELNNPASAAQRSAASLFAELGQYGNKKYALGALCLDPETASNLSTWMSRIREKVADFSTPDPLEGTGPLGAIDRETEILTWLQRHNVPNAWDVAPALAETRIPLQDLEDFSHDFPDTVLAPMVSTFASALRVERMAETIVTSTVRIFDFISAIKDYSYMDQAPLQAVDLAQSLETTLSMFASRLAGIHVVTDFSPDVPTIRAYGSELNQVWTAIIENALDAMPNGGILKLRTATSGPLALVEIYDTGQGIPQELQSRIYEPFFTTKPVGSALGLGLDTAQRIVNRHSGFITLHTRPGETCFQVRLPLDRAEAY